MIALTHELVDEWRYRVEERIAIMADGSDLAVKSFVPSEIVRAAEQEANEWLESQLAELAF